MNRRAAYPFFTLPDHAVGFEGWLIGDPDQPLHSAADVLMEWDYERDLEVSARFSFDLDEVSSALGMAIEDVSLSVQLKAGTGVGNLPRRVERLAVANLDTRSPRIALSALVPSHRLSGRLRFEALIVLDRAPGQRHALSPILPGSRLWSHRKEVLLEDGGDARFPIELISFGGAFRETEHENAPWYVHWRPGEMDADFAGAVRVYVNSDNKELAKRFVEGDRLTLEAILGDVASQMVASTIVFDEADEMLAECPEGSVGGQIRNWLDITFPGHSLASVRASLETTPGRFRAALLSSARIGDEG